MAFARLLNNLCDQLHETTGLLWGWAQGEGEATEAILRPLCFLDDSGYRFGISVAKIEGQLFVGIRIVHNRDHRS